MSSELQSDGFCVLSCFVKLVLNICHWDTEVSRATLGIHEIHTDKNWPYFMKGAAFTRTLNDNSSSSL